MKHLISYLLYACAVLATMFIGGILGYEIGLSQAKTIEVEKEVIKYVEVEKPTEKEEMTVENNEPEFESLGIFTATAYCPCEICCGVWATNRPMDENGNPIVYTASGERAIQGITIAADTNVLPFGMEVYINGNKYIVHDKGGAVKGNRIDIYFDNHAEALQWGRQEVELFVINEPLRNILKEC